MKKIWVASTNRAKIDGTALAFERFYSDEQFTAIGQTVPSPDTKVFWYGELVEQPQTDEDTRHGAFTRLKYLIDLNVTHGQTPDFYVAIEAGVAPYENKLVAFSWAAVSDGAHVESYGKSSSFILPPRIVEEIQKGLTLLEACKIVYPQHMNPNAKDGLISILSNGAVTRTELSAQAVMMALLEIKTRALYGKFI